MVNEKIRQALDEQCDDAIIFDNPSFDNSIIGITTDGCVVYSYEEMIQELANDDNISGEEAMEFIDYNTIWSIPYAGENAPVIMYDLML